MGTRDLFAVMDHLQDGIVNTCFLTVRLPRWAGARQNVLGSDMGGRPVESPRHAPAAARHEAPAAPAAEGFAQRFDVAPPSVDLQNILQELFALKEQVEVMRAKVDDLEGMMEEHEIATPEAPEVPAPPPSAATTPAPESAAADRALETNEVEIPPTSPAAPVHELLETQQ